MLPRPLLPIQDLRERLPLDLDKAERAHKEHA
jgi:hypothetical protein